MSAYEYENDNDDFPWEQYMQEELAIFEAQQQLNRQNLNRNVNGNNNGNTDIDGVRAPDQVIRETLIGSSNSNRTYVNNNSLLNANFIDDKIKREEEERKRRMDEINRQNEEYWRDIGEKLKPILNLTKIFRLDEEMKLLCINTEIYINNFLNKKSKFLYMNETDYDIFYRFIHFVYPIDNNTNSRKRISDELYSFIKKHFVKLEV